MMKFALLYPARLRVAVFSILLPSVMFLYVPQCVSAPDSTQAVKTALSENQSGKEFLKHNKTAEAEAAFKRAFSSTMQLPANHRDKDALIAITSDNLALMYNDNGRYPEAEEYFRKAADARDRIKGIDAKSKILTLTNLATALENQSKYTEATPSLQRALQIAEEAKVSDLEIAECCYALANNYAHNGKFSEAEPLHRRALAIREKLAPTSEDTMASLNALGLIYGRRAEYPQARPLFEKALSLRETIAGKNSPTIAAPLANLATVTGKMGRPDLAALYLARAISVTQGVKGQEAVLAALQRNLGSVYSELGRYEDAIRLMKEAIALTEKMPGDHLDSLGAALCDLGTVYQSQGKYSEAEASLLQGVPMLEKLYGPNHPEVARVLDNLGSLYVDEDKLEQAETVLMRSLRINEAIFGSKNPHVASVLETLAELKKEQNKLADADSYFSRALEIWKGAFGIDHPNYRTAARELSDVEISENKLDEAAALMQEVLSIDERLNGRRSGQVASDLLRLSRIYQLQRKPQQERDTASKANLIKQSLPGAVPQSAAEQPKAPVVSGQIGKKWALVIGISNFKDPAINLKYAAKDATDFSNFLVKNEHFKNDHVKLLVDEKATRQNIVDALGELGSKIDKKDLLVIYVSSHGGKPLHDTGVNFVVPYDGNFNNLLTSGIPMEWLSQIIREQVPCERVVILLDVCHSGAAAGDVSLRQSEDASSGAQSSAPGGKGLVYHKLNFDASKVTAGSGQFVLCSSQVNQRSWESKHYQNSVFTHWLMEGLKQRGSSTTLGEAYEFMKARVEDEVLRDRGEQQTPLIRKSWQGEEVSLGAP